LRAEFCAFYTLLSILKSARWAGAPSQETLRKEYLQARMAEAVARLAISEDVLSLLEIAEITEECSALSGGG
jgi:hypothetical protein